MSVKAIDSIAIPSRSQGNCWETGDRVFFVKGRSFPDDVELVIAHAS
ncbi:hypothetical protein [Egbenema bharatensis]